jgi:hypothetical protein
VALKRAVALRQVTPDECWWNSSCSRLARQSSLRRQLGDCELACRVVSTVGLLSESRRTPVELADGVAARRLAVAVCASDERSRGESNYD